MTSKDQSDIFVQGTFRINELQSCADRAKLHTEATAVDCAIFFKNYLCNCALAKNK